MSITDNNNSPYVIPFHSLRNTDVEEVGGKNASLGEMISQLSTLGVSVPGGFATTSTAFRDFLEESGLTQKINEKLSALDIEDLSALSSAGEQIRQWIVDAPLTPRFKSEIELAYAELTSTEGENVSFAVRSSATAEDLPDASFAGQQESYLNIRGLENILEAIKHVFASLYNDRAISYRVHKGFEHSNVALSAGVQRMVRSDSGSSGVMFTLDTESGFDKVVFITSAYGLGETVVQGQVNPDEFYVYKPGVERGVPAILRRNLGSKALRMEFSESQTAGQSTVTTSVSAKEASEFSINDQEVNALALQAIKIEKHYGRPMDIEWGKDGEDGKIYILQARPETVRAQEDESTTQERFKLNNRGKVLVEGRAIGSKIGSGVVRLVKDASEMHRVLEGDVLVTDMTDPDWEPVMKKASAIVTNRGGRTCHAAIIARELGIPAVVGTATATQVVSEGDHVTVSCAEGDSGFVYEGILDVEILKIQLDKLPEIPVKVSMNVGNPELAFDFQRLPNAGIGLARLEFIIARMIGIHPKAAIEFDRLPEDVKELVSARSSGYANPVDFYVEKLKEGISTLGAAFFPKPVIVRLSDFKSNEYSSLIGGRLYEPNEENPMLGFRGTSRYISDSFRDCFEFECRALKSVRDEMGLTNIEVMVPFVRTLSEAEQVIDLLASYGLKRGDNGLRIIMMCELPTNAILADEFLEFFDGFSIGSNDMTQLTLGLDRDSGIVAGQFDERDLAVKRMLHLAIDSCRKKGKYVGICGQGPSDHPDFAEWLVGEGIDAISLNPDTVVDTWIYLGKHLKAEKAA
ncbi:MAG: phosphoenolpyruvate synthase [Burkholderiales bacterium]|nr:phosphoenolpyruvate synthase [Burkholderiales bacterium]OUT76793.1 MAG: phosphoenolpyruvate synthase [Betaproteobacteria bacterium TMED22]